MADRHARAIGGAAPNLPDVMVLGPAPAPAPSAGLPQVDGICALFERAVLATPVSANDEVIDT